ENRPPFIAAALKIERATSAPFRFFYGERSSWEERPERRKDVERSFAQGATAQQARFPDPELRASGVDGHPMLIDTSRTDLRSVQQYNLPGMRAAPIRPDERVMTAQKPPPPELIDGQLPGRYCQDELLGVPQPLQLPLAPLKLHPRSRH